MPFTYDVLARLLSVTRATTDGCMQSYGYNPISNIISMTLPGAYTYNPSGANSLRCSVTLAAPASS